MESYGGLGGDRADRGLGKRGVAGSGARASSPKEEFGGRGPGWTIVGR